MSEQKLKYLEPDVLMLQVGIGSIIAASSSPRDIGSVSSEEFGQDGEKIDF